MAFDPGTARPTERLEFALTMLRDIVEALHSKEARATALSSIGAIRDCVASIEQGYAGEEPRLPDGPWLDAFEAFYADAANHDMLADMDLRQVFMKHAEELANDPANAGKTPDWCLQEAAQQARQIVAAYTQHATVN